MGDGTEVRMSRPALTAELSRYVLPPVHFDGLSLEAADPRGLAAFWRVVLDGTLLDLGDGGWRVDPGAGRPGNEIVRVRPGTRPPSRQTRVHLDVRLAGAEPDAIVAAGGRILREPGAEPWYVLADPEGNEFCAYPAVDDRPAGIFELVVKCRDAVAQAQWWSALLGGSVALEGEAAAVRAAPDFPWEYWLFDPVPEAKDGPNRLHWHVILRDGEPSDLVARGATVLRAPAGRDDAWVLADPEGNEFCAGPA
ncbi:VOC family protein [Actinoplanes sp. NPDC049681]|uniref:VOC family protein n=1 Tax=Actinoplanes sp. NPDC049681 TaxID=3363905 RepID=UPI00379CB61C